MINPLFPSHLVHRGSEDGRDYVEIHTGPEGRGVHIIRIDISPTGRFARVTYDGTVVAGR